MVRHRGAGQGDDPVAVLQPAPHDLPHGSVGATGTADPAVVRADGLYIVGLPKTDAGIRDVAIPPHLLPEVRAHLEDHTGPGRDALLFPAAAKGDRHMAPSTLYKVYYPARNAAGRPDLRWHDLRHTGATLAAQTGATIAELMGRLGHTTPGAAMRYQHAAADRDTEIARRLSELAMSTRGSGTSPPLFAVR